MRFKKIPVTSFQDVDYEFYYQLIINRIKTLLLQSDINKEFVFDIRIILLLILMANNSKATGEILQKRPFILIIIYY